MKSKAGILIGASLLLVGGFGCKPEDSAGVDEWVGSVRDKLSSVAKEQEKGEGASKGDLPRKKNVDVNSYTAKYEASQHRAVSDFPELGAAGSPFNSEFLARVKALKSEDIKYFNNPDWPYDLAKRVDEIMRTRRIDSSTVSTLLISQRPSLYVDQWVSTAGAVQSALHVSLTSPLILEMEGGVRVEIMPSQFFRRRGFLGEIKEGGCKLDNAGGGVVFLAKKAGPENALEGSWTSVGALGPGASLVLSGQVTRSGEKTVIKAAKLIEWIDKK